MQKCSRRAISSARSFCTSAYASSSPAAAAVYNRPLKAGVLPAYDQALAYIEKDRQSKLERLDKLSKDGNASKQELEKLQVEAWANDPETRWRANTGNGERSS